MTEFKTLETSDKPKVNECLRRFPPQISELTFTNLYVWRYHRPVRMAEVDGTLLFVELWSGERRLLGSPCGEHGVTKYLDVLRDVGVESFHRVPEGTAAELRRAGLHVQPDPENDDYVYVRSDLARLEGRRYHRQKNLVNRCLASYKCKYCAIDANVLDEVMEMHDRWFAERDLGQSTGLAEEYWAIREALAQFVEFGLIGGAVRIRGRMEAFTIGEALSQDTAVVHFEKATNGYTGLYQLVNKWFCEHGLTAFEYVNREQDLGIPGLRQAKESYNPHHMVRKFVARWADESASQAPGAAGCPPS